MDVTALIAGVGVAGVGIGLAMQGVLSNLVAGLTIIFTKPFPRRRIHRVVKCARTGADSGIVFNNVDAS